MNERKKILTMLVENNYGVTSRVSGVFSRRGFNLDSFTGCDTLNPRYSRITVVVRGDEKSLEQIEKQVAKLEDVLYLNDLTAVDSVCRELVLVKIRALPEHRQAIMAVTNIYHGKVVDVTRDSMITLLRDWGYTVREERLAVTDLMKAGHDGTLEEVFGTGTAAVISPVGELKYKDDVVIINDNKTGELTQRLYDTLTDIQWGRVEDKFGWTVQI